MERIRKKSKMNLKKAIIGLNAFLNAMCRDLFDRPFSLYKV